MSTWGHQPDGPRGAIGISANGLVRVELDAGGRVSDLTINPQALLTSATDLSADLIQAFHQAQDDSRAQAAQLVSGLSSPDRLQDLADRINDDADRRFSEISTLLHDLDRRTGSEW